MNQWVAVAVLGRTRGNRGEFTAVALCDNLERLQSLREVYLFGDGSRQEVEQVWLHDGRPVFKFRGIDSIADAEPWQGAEVRLPFEQRAPLDPGTFYQSDLVGCEVFERPSGARLGRVTGWQETGGPGLLQVTGEGGAETLVPFARSICVEIDPAARRILVELPEGLKELNRP